jgi:hypothetical protein
MSPARDETTVVAQQLWDFYMRRFPDESGLVKGNWSSRWRPLPDLGLNVALWVGADAVGVFLRGRRGEKIGAVSRRLAAHRTALEEAFRMEWREPSSFDGVFSHSVRGTLADRDNWPWMAEWLRKHANDWQERTIEALEGAEL